MIFMKVYGNLHFKVLPFEHILVHSQFKILLGNMKYRLKFVNVNNISLLL